MLKTNAIGRDSDIVSDRDIVERRRLPVRNSDRSSDKSDELFIKNERADCRESGYQNCSAVKKLREVYQKCSLSFSGLVRVNFNQAALMFATFLCICLFIKYHEIDSTEPILKPIFSPHSIVEEYINGDCKKAFRSTKNRQVAFFMFYAPWDADSQNVRNEFLETAYHFENQIDFKAVNCWQPQSECRARSKSNIIWPSMVAYRYDLQRSVLYSSLLKKNYFVRFLNLVSHPILKVTAQADLDGLLGHYDAVAVCFVSLKRTRGQYRTALNFALNLLSYFPMGDVRVAINTEQNNNSFGVQRFPSLHLYLWNQTLVYPNNNWQSENLTSWSVSKIERKTSWIQPLGLTLFHNRRIVDDKPLLVLLTPFDSIGESTYYYSTLRQVILESVNFNSSTKRYIDSIEMARKKKSTELLYWARECSQLKWSVADLQTTRSLENGTELVRYLKTKMCRMFNYSKKESFEQRLSFVPFDETNTTIPIRNDSFRHLSAVALDSLVYHQFAALFGLELKQRFDRTLVLILDEQRETHYLMNDTFNANNLRIFLRDYSLNVLDRFKFQRQFASPKYRTVDCDLFSNQTENVCIPELSTNNFLTTISNRNFAFLVYFYSLQCGLCIRYSLMFLNLAYTLKSISTLKLVRIDGDRNILPWQYTFTKFPTFLFIPEERKEDSKVYHSEDAINEKSLIDFMLNSHASEATKRHLHFAISNASSNASLIGNHNVRVAKNVAVLNSREAFFAVLNDFLKFRNSSHFKNRSVKRAEQRGTARKFHDQNR